MNRHAALLPDAPGQMTYVTGHGLGLLAWNAGRLTAHRLPSHDRTEEKYRPARGCALGELSAKLQAYFRGERVDFTRERRHLDLTCWTPFGLAVAEALSRVPYGGTITYADLAGAAGRPAAQRAVGNLMAKNPFPVLLPCHRVVRSDGRLGGFSAGKGWKERLARIEGITVPGLSLPHQAPIK